MGNLGSGELLVIFFVALIVLGPNKLPEAARQVGRAVNEIRRISNGFQREMREAMEEPAQAIDELKRATSDPLGTNSAGRAPRTAAISPDGEAPPTAPQPEPADQAATDPVRDDDGS